MTDFSPTASVAVNPLSAFMRQPKIYIRLPSQGEFWAEGSLEVTANGEYPVYSMTARDELLLKVPDALMNGQAVVDVIQNCMPNIKNAWAVPNIDMDVILIAIRLATYGEMMTTPLTVGNDIDLEYKVELRIVMDNLMNTVAWDPVVPVNKDLTIYIRPMDYLQTTKTALQTFETQKLMQVANSETIDDVEKIRVFKDSFSKLTAVTIDMVGSCIYRVDSSNGSTSNPEFIQQFVNNMDKTIFNSIQTHLERLRDQNAIKPISVPVTDELRAQGITSDTIEIPLTFDSSTFFV